ncbi:prolyl oligopeptidase family serine peptidase [Streptomyces sp. NPDC002888]|uniref:S9 family peptidase n=1 Tax=Streptomyces sp. NPDC002888 TaxID=3364668 RepID=UPI0036823B94
MAHTSLPGQLVRTARFTRGVPDRFTVTSDGGTVLYLRGRAGDAPAACLWALDVASGAERMRAGPAEGVDAYGTDGTGRLVAFTSAGALWAVDIDRGEPRPLPAASEVADPRPDPTGRRIAYVRGGALRVIDADGTRDRALAQPDAPDVEFAAAPHLDGARGYWWSPDGTRILVARTDSSHVRPWPACPAEDAPPVRHLAAAGTPNADVTLWLADLDGSHTGVEWDRKAFEYVIGAGWDTHGPYVAVQSRNQRTVRFLGIEPSDGGTTVLGEQRDEAWVQLVPGLPARMVSGSLLTHRDLRDTRHLTDDGVPVTPPGLQLRAVLGIDGDDVLFTASDEPTETHLWAYRAGSGIRRLSDEPGVHDGVSRAGTLVRVTRDGARPGGRAVVLRQAEPAALRRGKPTVPVCDPAPVPLASYAESPALDLHALRLRLGPRELRARLHFPSWHRPGGGPLPVLLDPYGGAGGLRVTADVDWKTLVSQWFAEHGFAVLVADGRGTPGRGPDWEREVHGDLFGPVLDDQVTALHEAARIHPDLDLGRVGIRGWSFSGSLAALAVLRRPDVFHAAVAGAGVTDQRLYDAHWRERFLGHPDRFPERYDACSLLPEAPHLTRPLLLIHGLADPKVPPAHTLRLSEVLRGAGRPHEVLLLPDAGHQPVGTHRTEDLLNRQVDFFQAHLRAGGTSPPGLTAEDRARTEGATAVRPPRR